MNTSLLTLNSSTLSFIALTGAGMPSRHKPCPPAFNTIHGFRQKEWIYPVHDDSLPRPVSLILQEDPAATGQFSIVCGMSRALEVKVQPGFKPDWIGILKVAPYKRLFVISPNRKASVFSQYFHDNWKLIRENPSPSGFLDLLDILLPENHLVLADLKPALPVRQMSFGNAQQVRQDASAMKLLQPLLDKMA